MNTNIPSELKEKLDSGTAIQKPIEYKEGQVITKDREVFVLVERMGEYPTKGRWALARWRVAFHDSYGNLIGDEYYRPIEEVGVPNTVFPEPILGLDWIPNVRDSDDNNEPREERKKKNKKKGQVKTSKITEEKTEEGGEEVKKGRGRPKGSKNKEKKERVMVVGASQKERRKDGRGRPEGEWNELKARNVFRDIAKGSKPYNQERIDKATEIITALGDDKFIKKYHKKFKEIGILPL